MKSIVGKVLFEQFRQFLIFCVTASLSWNPKSCKTLHVYQFVHYIKFLDKQIFLYIEWSIYNFPTETRVLFSFHTAHSTLTPYPYAMDLRRPIQVNFVFLKIYRPNLGIAYSTPESILCHSLSKVSSSNMP